MSEKTGLAGIWEDLSDNLIVSVETYEDNSSGSDLPLITKFTVTNGAPKSDSSPDIFFEEVVLTVGVPPDLHVEKHKDLTSGESFIYEHRSRYSDLGRIVFSVDGAVSPEYLLRVKREARNIPSSVSSLSITSYIEALKDMNIHKWLNNVIEAMLIPGPDTTEAEIKAQQDKLSNAMQEIRTTKGQLDSIFSFVRMTDKEKQQMADKLGQHRKLVGDYLQRTDRECSELRKTLDILNAKTLSTNRDNIAASLSQNASQIDRASEDLLLEK